MQPKRRMKEAKKSLQSMGAKKTDKREKTEKEQVQLEHKPLENDDEEGHCNIHVAIKEQQEKNTVDSTRKRKKEKRTGSQRKKLKATNIDA